MPKLRLPHPLVLLLGCVLVAAALTWVLPAGAYDRRDDPATGRQVAVAGTYHAVPAAPVGPFAAVVGVARGLVAAAEVVVVILLVGGAWTVVDRTGALAGAVAWLAVRFARRRRLAIPIIALAFAAGGALENMQEEIIPLVPVLLVLARGLGFDLVTVAAMSAGAAIVGSAFSPINPFQAGIALKVAQLPLLSLAGLRLGMLAAGLVVFIWWTMRHAARHPLAADATIAVSGKRLENRQLLILGLIAAPFAAYIVGVTGFGWGLNELSAAFLIFGFAVGLVGRLGLEGTVEAYFDGMRSVVGAAVLVGVARSISLVLEDGRVVDTILQALVVPLAQAPRLVGALLMIPVHALVHIPVSSVSGQAVLTMPVMVPMADLLGFSRDAAVLAYQTGAGLADLWTPTNGALMAILLASGTRYGAWLRFVIPVTLMLTVIGIVGIVLALGVPG